MRALLHRALRTLGPVFYSQLDRALIGSPLPLGDGPVLVWPQVVSLLAGTCRLFSLGCIIFQRREIRA